MWGCVWRCGLKVTIYPDSPRMLTSRRSFYLDKVQRPTSSLHQFSLPAGLDVYIYDNPTNTKRSPSAGLMLVHRLRRWPNIEPALGGRLALAGNRTKVQNAYTSKMSRLSCSSKPKISSCSFISVNMTGLFCIYGVEIYEFYQSIWSRVHFF